MPVRDPIHFLAMHFRVELPELLRRYRGSPNTALHTAVLSPSEILSGGAVAASSEVDRSVGTHVYETVKLTTRPAMDLRRGALDASGWEELTRNDMMVPRLRLVGEPIIFYCSHRCLLAR